MTYRKGEVKKWQIDQGWPYQVCVVVPGTGLGSSLNEMLSFCRTSGFDHKTRSELPLGGQDLMLWCFTRQRDALAFRSRFQATAEIVPESQTPAPIVPRRSRG